MFCGFIDRMLERADRYPLEVKESFLNVCEYERTSVLQEKANKKAYVPQYCIYIYIYTGICSRYTMLASIFLKVIIL